MKPRWERKAVLGLLILGVLLPLGIMAELDETDLESDVGGDWDSNIDQSVETEEVVEETEEAEEEVLYATPKAIPSAYLMETFDDLTNFENTWIKSEAKKEGVDEDIAKYDGVWAVETAERMPLIGDRGLILKSKAKHAAIAAPLKKPFTFNKKPLVVQYEVNMQNGQECGGSYIKLISASKGRVDLKTFHDKTPYTIMFGPDKCGNDHKLHFIFRHVNPLTGEIEEKHAKRPRDKIEEPFKDKKSHLYTLVIRPDNTFDINLDHELISSGSLLEDFTPPVNPPKEIDDPEDFMPEDWDEREKIPDPEATKPDDWDEEAPMQIADPVAEKPSGWLDEEPEMIPDPTAEKPEDWDDEMDGEWEAALISNPVCADAPGCGEWKAPMVDNPAFKGKWRPPMIDNPNYRGKWKPRKIPNPDFFEDLEPFKMTAIDAVGLELWSMSDNILFDNFLITDNIADANQFAAETYDLKVMKIEKGSSGVFRRIINYSNKNPWLYGIYVLLVAIPVVLIFAFCCAEVKDSKDDKAAKQKKTDEPSPDDPQPEEADSNPNAGDDDAPVSGSDAEGDEDKAEDEEDKEDEEEEGEEEDEEEKEEKAEETEEVQTRTSPRLRKSRRE